MKKLAFCVLTAAAAVTANCALAGAGLSVIKYTGSYTITNATDTTQQLTFALQDDGVPSHQLSCNSMWVANNQIMTIAPRQIISCQEKEKATTSGTIYFESTIHIATLSSNTGFGIPGMFDNVALSEAVDRTTVWSPKQVPMPTKSADSKNEIAITIN